MSNSSSDGHLLPPLTDELSRVPIRDIGPHPVVDGGLRGRIVLHPARDGQMDPGGVTLALDSPIDRSGLEDHPMVRYLVACGWSLRSLIEGTHWTLTPPDWVQRQ